MDSTYNLPFTPGSHNLDHHTLSLNATHPYSGEIQYDTHNLYGHGMGKAVHEYWDTMEMRPFTLMRSTFAGSGKYGQHMLRGSEGEWKDMRLAIAGMMNFNMFGIPMVGADVCGSWSTNVTAN